MAGYLCCSLAILVFWSLAHFQVAYGFEWEASSPQDGATIKACPMNRISFYWKFSVAVEESVMYVEWHKETDGIYQIIATSVAGFFIKLPKAKFDIAFLRNAAIQISNFTREDYGRYRVSVIYKVNGTLYSESSSVVLELPDTPVLENNRLSVHIQPEPVTDVSTRERHVQLTCGTFLRLGSRPLVVEWKKKVDVKQNSDIIRLNGELAKQKEVDAALASSFTKFQGQITEQEKTDERLRTALQSEQAKVRLIEAQINEMKALGLKERLQQTEANWASDLKRIEHEMRLIAICEAGSRFQSSCYSVVKKRLTWTKANGECKSKGGKLAEISSAQERDHVKEIANASGLSELWLGGTDTENEGVWKWASSGSVFSFTDWNKGEPNDAQGGEDCFTMAKNKGWTWNDEKCNNELSGALCEFSSPF